MTGPWESGLFYRSICTRILWEKVVLKSSRILEESLWALIRGSSVLFSEFIFWWILFWERELYIPQADTKIQNKIIVGKLLKLQAYTYLLLTLQVPSFQKPFVTFSTLHLENSTKIQYTLLDLWYYSDCILVGVYQLMEMLMPISALTIGRSMYRF